MLKALFGWNHDHDLPSLIERQSQELENVNAYFQDPRDPAAILARLHYLHRLERDRCVFLIQNLCECE